MSHSRTTLLLQRNLPITHMPYMQSNGHLYMVTCTLQMQTPMHPCVDNQQTQQKNKETTKVFYIKQNIHTLHTRECKNSKRDKPKITQNQHGYVHALPTPLDAIVMLCSKFTLCHRPPIQPPLTRYPISYLII